MDSPFEMSQGLGDNFSGEVRLFPLPNAVLFPNVLLPLHIFEPRYIEMTREALEGDGLIAMAQIKSGWEISADETPEIHPVICIGRIAHHVRLDDGRYNLILQGLSRASIIEELPPERSFRRATVELLAEEPFQNIGLEDQRRAELLQHFRRLFPKLNVEHELHAVFESEIPLGILCDVFAYALSLAAEDAQRLLSEFNVERRCRLLLQLIEKRLVDKESEPDETGREFPPPFSLN